MADNSDLGLGIATTGIGAFLLGLGGLMVYDGFTGFTGQSVDGTIAGGFIVGGMGAFATLLGLPGIIASRKNFIGYRTCHRCHEEGKKKNMIKISVPDGIMDSRLDWAHKDCAREYLTGSKTVKGPFTYMTNIAASYTPKKTLEKLSLK